MSPLRVLVVALVLALAVEALNPTKHSNMRFRRRRAFAVALDAECGPAQATLVAGAKADWEAAGDLGKADDLTDDNGSVAVVGASTSTLKWDKVKKAWRYGAASCDSATGKTIANQKMNADGPSGPFTDLCKIYPAWCPTFCGAKDSNKADFCCPAKDPSVAVCPASVTGVPRKYMPQIMGDWAIPQTEDDVKGAGAWAAGIPKKVGDKDHPFMKWMSDAAQFGADFACPLVDVAVKDLKPTQDEISGFKSVKMYCDQVRKPATFKAKIRPRPVICKDNRIFDGHHRWSAFKFAAENNLDYDDGGAKKMNGDYMMKAYKCNQDCDAMMTKIKTLWGKPHVVPKQVDDKAVEFAFAELESKFGRSAHSTMAEAQGAYVQATRARLADAGMEMKGGDEALADMFHMAAGHLWA